jgi:hypothetical protein
MVGESLSKTGSEGLRPSVGGLAAHGGEDRDILGGAVANQGRIVGRR